MRVAWIFIILVAIGACVDPITIKTPDATFQLAVDGSISTGPGPYTVSLFRASSLNEDLDRRVPVSRAKVTIADDAGNTEVLKEDPYGIYSTRADGIQGVVGRTYTLQIVTLEGKVFESLPERIKPAGKVDSLYYEFEKREIVDANGQLQSADGFNVYMDASSVPGEENLYRWRFLGTYEIETFPQLRTIRDPNGAVVPAPVPCSGFEVNARGFLVRHFACECCTCWITQFEDKPLVSDDQFISGNKFNRVWVGFVPITRKTFYHDQYHVAIQQMSLSRAAFDFWRIVRSQKDGASSLFQPPSGKVRSNIFAKNGTEEVQGIFYATAIHEKSIFIKKSDIPYKVQAIDTLTTSCKYLEFSTNIKPAYWK